MKVPRFGNSTICHLRDFEDAKTFDLFIANSRFTKELIYERWDKEAISDLQINICELCFSSFMERKVVKAYGDGHTTQEGFTRSLNL